MSQNTSQKPAESVYIFVGSDHAGYELKVFLKEKLEKDYEFVDMGTFSGPAKSCDYPYFAHKTVREYINFTRKNPNKKAIGLLICGSGIGMSITANRNRFIRAALCYNADMSRLTREHNNANFLCLGARFISPNEAIQTLQTFINTPFFGGRHHRRVKKINLPFYKRSIFLKLYDLFSN